MFVLIAGGGRTGAQLASLLVERRLAACVQVTAIESTYRWKNKVTCEPEFLLLIKTVSERYPEVESTIRANHSYEGPEIVMLPITQGSQAYLDWIGSNTKE